MPHRIIIINGPNINLLGEREKSQYGKLTFDELKEKCLQTAINQKIEIEFYQSNIEGEIVTKIQDLLLALANIKILRNALNVLKHRAQK